MNCPPKSSLPKGTLAPNSGNVSSTTSSTTRIKTNATCGQAGVIYSPGPQGPPGII